MPYKNFSNDAVFLQVSTKKLPAVVDDLVVAETIRDIISACWRPPAERPYMMDCYYSISTWLHTSTDVTKRGATLNSLERRLTREAPAPVSFLFHY